MARTKLTTTKMTLDDMVSSAFSIAEELQDEMQTWFDNLPESLQGGDRGSAIQDAADALSNVSQVDVPTLPEDLDSKPYEVSYATKRKMSRSLRRDEAVSYLQRAVEIAQELEDEFTDRELATPEGETPPERPDYLDDLSSFRDDLENAIGELENVEFPGMYG